MQEIPAAEDGGTAGMKAPVFVSSVAASLHGLKALYPMRVLLTIPVIRKRSSSTSSQQRPIGAAG